VNDAVEFLVRSTLIGAGATLVIDVWAALLRRFGVPSLNFALLGRWITHTIFGLGLFLAARAMAWFV